jgi:hypothetical protein
MFSIVLNSQTPDVMFKLIISDEVSKFFKGVIKAEHYIYNPSLLHLQSVDQGKEWKCKIEYAVNIECEKLTGCIYRKDKFNRQYEPLATDQFKLLYIPKSNSFCVMNFSDSSFPFDFLAIEQSMTA